MPTIRVADLAMGYDDLGRAKAAGAAPILFIHGAVQTRGIWSEQAAHLSREYRVIAPDLRGHGETPLGDTPTTVQQLAADCLELLALLNVPQAVVCGVSLGGMVALEMAAQAPEAVRALVLANTPTSLSSHRLIRRVVQWIGPQRLLHPMFGLLGRERTAHLGLWAAEYLVGPYWVGREARAHFVRGFTSMSEDAIVATYRALVESRPVDLGAIDCPCLVITGSNDAPSIREQAKDIRSEADEAHIWEMEAGHVANLDDPATFNALISRFIDRLTDERAT